MSGILGGVFNRLPEPDYQSLTHEQRDKILSYCRSAMEFLVHSIHGSTQALWWSEALNDGNHGNEYRQDAVMGIQLLTETLAYFRAIEDRADYRYDVPEILDALKEVQS